MTYYQPVLTLTLIDLATQKWELKTEIYYPAQETGRNGNQVVVSGNRRIEVDVVADPSFQHNHVVTFTETITRDPAETEVTVTVKKDGKRKGSSTITYSQATKFAA